MTTPTAPPAYPIADLGGLTIRAAYDPDAGCHTWHLACPHGGAAVLRLRCHSVGQLERHGELEAFVAAWWRRQAAGFGRQWGCACGEAGA